MALPGSRYFARSVKTRVHHRHRRRYSVLIAVAVVLLLAAFILQLLVALSLPIIKRFYLLRLVSTTTDNIVPTSIATELRFGVWGYCALSVLDYRECSSPRLGYEVNNAILALTGQAQLLKIVLKGLTIVLILHPICAGLTVLALLFALFSFVHAFAICSLIWTIVSAILASVSTAADIAIVAVAMDRVADVTSFQFKVKWGNAPWMSLVATILLWMVVILQSAIVCGCCGVSPRIWTRIDYSQNEREEKEGKDRDRETRVAYEETR